MDVLHPAIDKLSTRVPPERWQLVDVAIAPSTIKITDGTAKGRLIEECRVRYLSFMGIGHNVKSVNTPIVGTILRYLESVIHVLLIKQALRLHHAHTRGYFSLSRLSL